MHEKQPFLDDTLYASTASACSRKEVALKCVIVLGSIAVMCTVGYAIHRAFLDSEMGTLKQELRVNFILPFLHSLELLTGTTGHITEKEIKCYTDTDMLSLCANMTEYAPWIGEYYDLMGWKEQKLVRAFLGMYERGGYYTSDETKCPREYPKEGVKDRHTLIVWDDGDPDLMVFTTVKNNAVLLVALQHMISTGKTKGILHSLAIQNKQIYTYPVPYDYFTYDMKRNGTVS